MPKGVEAAYYTMQAAAAQLHLTGVILAALNQKGVITQGEARAFVADAARFIEAENPMRELYDMLLKEFPEAAR